MNNNLTVEQLIEKIGKSHALADLVDINNNYKSELDDLYKLIQILVSFPTLLVHTALPEMQWK